MGRLMAYVAFGGDSNPDPDSAALELERAGCAVHRMPAHHPLLTHPLDDHIECIIPGAADDKSLMRSWMKWSASLIAMAARASSAAPSGPAMCRSRIYFRTVWDVDQ